MTTAVLYDSTPDLDCFKVRLLLDAAGITHDRVLVDLVPGTDVESRRHLALHPSGTLPIMAVGDEILSGAEQILMALVAQVPAAAPFGVRLEDQPSLDRWLEFANTELSAVTHARRTALFASLPDPDALRGARRALLELEDELTLATLAGRAWFVGDACSIADFALYPAVALSRDIGLEHHEFPALRPWLKRVRATAPNASIPGIPDVS